MAKKETELSYFGDALCSYHHDSEADSYSIRMGDVHLIIPGRVVRGKNAEMTALLTAAAKLAS